MQNQDIDLIGKLKNEAEKTKLQLEEVKIKIKKKNEDDRELLRRNILRELKSKTLYGIANHMNRENLEAYYQPYLIDFKTLLERLQENENDNLFEEELKIKLDLIEQISKMKDLPNPNTICHIESNSLSNSSRFRYFLKKFFFIHKKYKIIFHSKHTNLEDKFYDTLWSRNKFILSCILGAILSFSIISQFPIVFVVYFLCLLIFC